MHVCIRDSLELCFYQIVLCRFIDGRDATLGLMIVVLVSAGPITVMYSIYVAAEAARSKCFAITMICMCFTAGISLSKFLIAII